MADLQRVRTDYDPVDQQLQDPLPLRQGRVVEPRPHALAERRQVGPDCPRRLALGTQPLFLVALCCEHLSPSPDLFTALLELVEVDRLGLVGVEQALLFAVEPTELGLPPLARGLRAGVLRVGLLGQLLELGRERGGVLEQPPDMPPDGGIELLDLRRRLRATAVPVPGDGVLAVAVVVPMHMPPADAARRDAEQRQPARPAGQQAPQQVVVAGIVAVGEGRVAGQLLGRRLARRFVDDGRHGDGDPLGAGAGLAAGRRAGPWAGGAGLAWQDEHMAIRVRRPGVDRVRQDVVHDAVGPEPFAVAGPPRPGGQPLEDLADGHPLVDQPAVQHPDHLRLGVVDLQVPGDTVPRGDVAVAIRRPAEDPLAGPGLLELAPAEAFPEDGPLVLGDRPLDLEQELVVRIVGDRPLDERDIAGGLAEFLEQEDLVGVAPGEPVGAIDAEDLELTLARGVAEAVECGAVEPRAGVALIDIDVLVLEFVSVIRHPAAQRVELAVNGLVPALPLG